MNDRPTQAAGGRILMIPKLRGHVEVVQHAGDGQRMRHPLAHLLLGIDDPVGTDALEDRAVQRGRCLGDDLGDAQVLERHRREDARIGGAADRDDRELEIAGADGPQGAFVGGIELRGVRDLRRDLVDGRLVPVERQDLVAEGHELEGGGRPEPPETDDEDRWLHGSCSSG